MLFKQALSRALLFVLTFLAITVIAYIRSGEVGARSTYQIDLDSVGRADVAVLVWSGSSRRPNGLCVLSSVYWAAGYIIRDYRFIESD